MSLFFFGSVFHRLLDTTFDAARLLHAGINTHHTMRGKYMGEGKMIKEQKVMGIFRLSRFPEPDSRDFRHRIPKFVLHTDAVICGGTPIPDTDRFRHQPFPLCRSQIRYVGA